MLSVASLIAVRLLPLQLAIPKPPIFNRRLHVLTANLCGGLHLIRRGGTHILQKHGFGSKHGLGTFDLCTGDFLLGRENYFRHSHTQKDAPCRPGTEQNTCLSNIIAQTVVQFLFLAGIWTPDRRISQDFLKGGLSEMWPNLWRMAVVQLANRVM